MADKRRLQGEIERCLKKVTEGVETFEDIWQKVHNATNSNQKEKYESDLKKEIKKLQRLRDQIKTWLASSDIKDKRQLIENRKLIETQMERFKVVERETKTKAYSKEGLGAAQKLDPAQQEKDEMNNWLSNSINALNLQSEQYESEIESLLASFKKKRDKEKEAQIEKIKTSLIRHRFHIVRLETILRKLDNMTLDVEQIKMIKDDVEYYIENQDQFGENSELIYDDLDLDSVETIALPKVVTVDEVAATSSTIAFATATTTTITNSTSVASSGGNTTSLSTTASSTLGLGLSLSLGLGLGLVSVSSSTPATTVVTSTATAPSIVASTATLPTSTSFETPLVTPVLIATPTTIITTPTTSAFSITISTPTSNLLCAPSIVTSAAIVPSTNTAALSQLSISAQSLTSQSPSSTKVLPPSTSSFSTSPTTLVTTTASNVSAAAAGYVFVNASPTGLSTKASTTPTPTPAPNQQSSTLNTSSSNQAQSESNAQILSTLIPPLLGVAPLGPVSLSKTSFYQLAMLDAAANNTIYPTDSQRLRLHLPPNRCQSPAYYPQTALPLSDNTEFFSRLSTETLFFVFYFMEGTKAQFHAARALKKQSWRFHTKYLMWFQRHEEPKTITDEYEQGTYIYFDYDKWGQRKKEGFTFEYKYLEDKDLNHM